MPRRYDPRPSRLLIQEPPLQVLPTLAVKIGLAEAIFLQQLHYWLLQSGNERDGQWWIYNTYEEWHRQLPFFSVRTIRRIVAELERLELVVSTSDYNASKIDRTKWYRINYDAVERLADAPDVGDADLPETADHVANLDTSSGQRGQMHVANMSSSIPETSSETTQRDERPKTQDEVIAERVALEEEWDRQRRDFERRRRALERG